MVNTKVKGEIAESSVIIKALRKGWSVLRPVVDAEKYDLVFSVDGSFVKVQVKHAWWDDQSNRFICDVRKTNTNRREIKRVRYSAKDFDFAIVYVDNPETFYVFPAKVFNSYRSNITLSIGETRQRLPKSAKFLERWDLIPEWASTRESV